MSAEQTPLKQTDREEEEEEGALTDWLCLFVCQKEQAGGQSVSQSVASDSQCSPPPPSLSLSVTLYLSPGTDTDRQEKKHH